MQAKVLVAVVYGLGDAMAETWPTGQRQLVAWFKALGVDTGESPYDPSARNAIYYFLRSVPGAKIAIIGDSLGANNAPLYAEDQAPRKVDFIGGFQPSLYGQGVNPASGLIAVPSNVLHGMCIWDPVFADTSGLGNAHWEPSKGIDVLERRGAHPDDWGTSQQLMFTAAKQALGL